MGDGLVPLWWYRLVPGAHHFIRTQPISPAPGLPCEHLPWQHIDVTSNGNIDVIFPGMRIYSWWTASGWMMPAIAESQWPAGHAFSGVMPCTNEFHLHHCSNWRCTKSASVQLHMAGKSHLTWWGIDIILVDLRKSFTILKLLMNQVGFNNYDPSIVGLCWTALLFVCKNQVYQKAKI